MKFLKFLLSLWRKLAAGLGWINTRILLTITYFLLISPLALLYRLFGEKPLNLKFDKKTASYWEERPQKEFKKETYFRPF